MYAIIINKYKHMYINIYTYIHIYVCNNNKQVHKFYYCRYSEFHALRRSLGCLMIALARETPSNDSNKNLCICLLLFSLYWFQY